MKEGIVKFFNKAKGFGFITEKGTNRDIFVHVSALTEDIGEEDHVRFDVEQGVKGLSAIKVEKA
ncbi:cold shock domain-containing protein [Subsaxibacter sp. CAU 1640]|uniref:cold-shock protein n=1 Tax=Subsaxibacter sp. CAU 1640 TaxID=2933271 RepID=UPI002003ACD7|nr:cold shock domain-containing protein [Subsaxibacter sp. CAU 1640]MCK7590594.1 cold shock domain-containing protein [Subsaxibacter sp. CAU 1640]